MSFVDCYACGGTVARDAVQCTACGAEQSPAAARQYQTVQRLRATIDQWRTTAVAGVLVAFALGLGVGFWATSFSDARPTQLAAQASTVPLSRAQINDIFIRVLNAQFEKQGAPLNILSWVPVGRDGVVFELQPPTREQPAVLWEALTDADRVQLMGYIAIAYAKTLAAGGIVPNVKRDGFPYLALQYRGYNQPLVTRNGDGKIYLGRSPFAAAYAPQPPAPASAPRTPGPAR